MKIAFIHNHQAFLPELSAYQLFFQKQNIETCIASYGQEKNTAADVYWYMMGLYPRAIHKKKLIVHEYCSASIPPYRKIKDFAKKIMNPRPHFRLYLNEYVRQQLNIHDEIPFGYRDMGVLESFAPGSSTKEKKYDFVYSGNLSAERKLDKLLTVFDQGSLKEHSILMLGMNQEGLEKSYRHCPNIFFRQAASWDEVPALLSDARFAINYITNEEPFNAQTSTKFLEYAAMKIPIISNSYFWVSEFQERYGGNYFFVKDDFSNFTWDRITLFPYAFPKLESWIWDKRITESGILDFLRQA